MSDESTAARIAMLEARVAALEGLMKGNLTATFTEQFECMTKQVVEELRPPIASLLRMAQAQFARDNNRIGTVQ